ncbi:hypothetical protein BU17DRAFT_61147 [Hysterangium stoloniferum]|nr:hypothetical protein BU17DRAFT_61147 [Hysterangium stoloniferum]
MKRQTQGGLATTAKLLQSIDTVASGGEGLEASPPDAAVSMDGIGLAVVASPPSVCLFIEKGRSQHLGHIAFDEEAERGEVELMQGELCLFYSGVYSNECVLSFFIFQRLGCNGGICARDYCQFPTGWSHWVGQFQHPPLANIGIEAYRVDSRLDGATCRKHSNDTRILPWSVSPSTGNGDPASMLLGPQGMVLLSVGSTPLVVPYGLERHKTTNRQTFKSSDVLEVHEVLAYGRIEERWAGNDGRTEMEVLVGVGILMNSQDSFGLINWSGLNLLAPRRKNEEKMGVLEM